MKSCEEIQVICSKSQYRESSLWERLQMKLHMLICKSCGLFTKKNSKLSALLKKAPIYRMSESEKERLKSKLRQQS